MASKVTVRTPRKAKRTPLPPLPPLPNIDAFPTIGYSRWRDLRPFVRYSREWVRLREKEGRFPKRMCQSPSCTVWPNSEIKRWLADPMGYRAEAACDER